MKKKLIFLLLILFILTTIAATDSPYARRIRPVTSVVGSCSENEIAYNMTDHTLYICTNSGYSSIAAGGGGSAPSDATYITQTANASLSNEQALGSLATGLLKNATTTGILSIATAGVDYENPLTFSTGLTRSTNTITVNTSQNIATLSNLLTNGFVKTSGGTGLLSIDTSTYLTGNQSITLSGDVSGSGTTAITTAIGNNKITGAMIAMGSDALGDILYYNGTDYVRLPKGSDGTILTLASSIPSWAAAAGGGSLGTGNVSMTVANASSTGTTVNRLAKLTGAPSTALISATTDTENALGICTSGCGTTGNATIALLGQVTCDFDNATTAGDYFIISTITAGKCHDNGATFPTAAAAYGRVLTTNGASGSYVVELMTPDIAFQNAGNGKSKPGGSNLDLQWNNSGVFAGGIFKTNGTSQVYFPDTTWTLGWGTGGGSYGISANATGVQLNSGADWIVLNSFRLGGTATSPRIYMGGNVSSAGGITLVGNNNLGWVASNTDATGNQDIGMSRNAAGVLEVNKGNPTSAGSETDLRDTLSRHYYTGLTTTGNCLDSAGAAACGAATGGNFVIDATTTSTVVSTTQVKADSQIYVQFDSSLGTRLSVTCNTTPAIPAVTARTAGTSFTVTIPAAPTTNPACYSYHIVN